jgi:hypothetical protein
VVNDNLLLSVVGSCASEAARQRANLVLRTMTGTYSWRAGEPHAFIFALSE